MIKDNFAQALTKCSTKTFSHMSDPSKMTIQRIFNLYWDSFLKTPEVIRRGVRSVVASEVSKMLDCGTLNAGFEIYECPNCHKSHIICYSCKSRFCNSCGVKAAQIRAKYLEGASLNVPHRHIVFTIDDRLRNFFLLDRNLLNALFSAANDTLKYAFDKLVSKKKTFTPGFILTLHTFGRALNWNPHIHCLCTEGGMDDEHNYKAIKYLNYETLRKAFMKQLRVHMLELSADSHDLHHQIKETFNQIYKDKKDGFYVNAPQMKDKNGKKAVFNYIIRYTGRPVMASSRITDFNHDTDSISYYYEDHKTNDRVDVCESVYDFIKKLIIHIPEPQFKMVRYYGIYATCDHLHKEKVHSMLNSFCKNKQIYENFLYRKSLIDTFHVDPLLCDCGHYMEYVDYWVPAYRRTFEDDTIP